MPPLKVEIQYYATLIGVKLFRPGTFYPSMGGSPSGVTYTSQDIETMIADSNSALPIIIDSIQFNSYPDGNDPALSTDIPAMINIAHNKYFKKKMKDWAQNVRAKFRKVGEYVVADLFNVDSELAKYLEEQAPSRSVEIIPELVDGNGNILKNVIRSIAFLPKDIKPAVSELTVPDFAVQYAAEGQKGGLLTLFVEEEQQQHATTHEVTNMGNTKQPTPQEEKQEGKNQTPESKIEESPSVSVVEFQEVKARLDREQKEKESLAQKVLLMEQALQRQALLSNQKSVAAYCDRMMAQGYAPAIFDEKLRAALLDLRNTGRVVKFSEQEEISLADYVEEKLESVLKMQAVKVPLKEEAGDAVGSAEMTQLDKQNKVIQQFMETEKLGWVDAMNKAINTNPELFD